MDTLLISGPDGSGKTTLVTHLCGHLGLGVLPRMSDTDKQTIQQMLSRADPLADIAHAYFESMMRIYETHANDPKTYIADRGVFDLLAMMQANRILNNGPQTDADLSRIPVPKAVIYLDCDVQTRRHRFNARGTPLSQFDALSIQEGCQPIFNETMFEFFKGMGLTPKRFLKIDGTKNTPDEIVKIAGVFLNSLGFGAHRQQVFSPFQPVL